MKVHIELELTPEEARELVGLPNISSLHETFLNAASAKIAQTAGGLDIDPMIKTWSGLGGLAQETIGSIMSAALNAATKPAASPSPDNSKHKKSKSND